MRGRKKATRQKTFRSIHRRFGSLDKTKKREVIKLNHDELEAIKLADFEELYHEECAAKLGISRTTFSRTLKVARYKLAQMLLFGYELEIEESNHPYSIGYPSDDKITIASTVATSKFFVIAEVEKNEIVGMKFVPNPLIKDKKPETNQGKKHLETGKILPPIFADVNIAVFQNIGENLKSKIESLGVTVLVTNESNIDNIVKTI